MRKNGRVTAGGTEMYYVSFGLGRRKLVVLPGLSDGLATVKGKAWVLSFPYRRFFPDYTVYMFSRKNRMPEGYSIRDMANDQVLVMKELGIHQAYLLGVSQGGMIAQWLAIDHPDKVGRLVLTVTLSRPNDTVRDVIHRWLDIRRLRSVLLQQQQERNARQEHPTRRWKPESFPCQRGRTLSRGRLLGRL